MKIGNQRRGMIDPIPLIILENWLREESVQMVEWNGWLCRAQVLIPMVVMVHQSKIVCAFTDVRKVGPRSINRGWGPLLKFICTIHHRPSRFLSKRFLLYWTFMTSVFGVVRAI